MEFNILVPKYNHCECSSIESTFHEYLEFHLLHDKPIMMDYQQTLVSASKEQILKNNNMLSYLQK